MGMTCTSGRPTERDVDMRVANPSDNQVLMNV